MADDSMLPKPGCEFDFSLLPDLNAEEDNMDTSGGDQSATENHQDDEGTNGSNEALETTEYTFAQGFSDDEGGEEAFDRTFAGHQARKASSKQKKPPRRSEDGDADDEDSPKAKKPRKSLFGGGPVEDTEEPHNFEDDLPEAIQDQEMEDRVNDVEEDSSSSHISKPDIRQRMSSLNLDMQEQQDSRPFSLGFGLAIDNSAAPSRAASEESVNIPKEIVYDLRQNIDRSRRATYLDSDKTGNYDPVKEARLKMLSKQRAKAARKKGKGKGKAKAPKEHVLKCIVKLRFKAFGNVRNIVDDFEHWPEDWSNIDSDYEEDTKPIREFYRRNTPETEIEPQVAIEDPKGEADDLTGRPEARGCKHCRSEGQNCTMIEGSAYPCERCEDDEIDCVPCMPPKVRARCRQCMEDGNDDYYIEQDPSQLKCDHCTQHEYTCEPVPPRGYKVLRASYEEVMYSENRKHVQCTSCRIDKKRCSLKKKTDKPPCKSCKKAGTGCTFCDTPKFVKAKKTPKSKLDVYDVSKPGSDFFSPEDLEDMDCSEDDALPREATPEIEMEDDAGNKGPLTKIKTSYSHPIQFGTEGRDCSFCEMQTFGFFGHFEREVHVIAWYSGLGFTETGGGWAEERGATMMCETCTATRLQIVLCPSHELQNIVLDGSAPNPDFLTDELISTEPASLDMRAQLQRWCSLCYSPAAYGCSTTQPSVANDEELVGCGLRLCHKCASKLRDEHIWNLPEMAKQMDVIGEKVSEEDAAAGNMDGKVRADAGFLRNDGLLMRCMVGDEAEMEEE